VAGAEITFSEHEFIVSKTDLNGKITYGNELFIQISGYGESELMGQPHNILRHEEMPSIIFKLLWEKIKSGREVFAYVKNRSKNGDFYWVLAHVTPSFDLNRSITNYHSVRRKPSEKALKTIIPLYMTLLEKERSGGVSSSEKELNHILSAKGVTYEQFIFSL
jgi:PAS domain S-box-containing protein